MSLKGRSQLCDPSRNAGVPAGTPDEMGASAVGAHGARPHLERGTLPYTAARKAGSLAEMICSMSAAACAAQRNALSSREGGK